MKMKSFNEYKLLRENQETKVATFNAVTSKVTLGEGNQYPPFEISDDVKSGNYGKNKNLAPLVRAFKQGANWGWSKDDSTGNDKPVKIGGKKLYLSGGSVRDHLLGKKIKHYDLATNASPDEVFNILKQNDFNFINSKSGFDVDPSKTNGHKQYFWVKKTNSKGRPFVFGVVVNEDEYNLEVFMRTPRGINNKELEAGTQEQDASGRDFTINGMYILLSNDNGPNKELIDYYGGMHHLASKKINPIGDLDQKFSEDPSRILRYIRMLTNYGDPSRVGEEERSKIKNMSDKLMDLDRNCIMGEFKKGLDREDVDPRTYLSAYNDFGALDKVFPGKILDTDFPKELTEIGDRHAPIAWMLRMNDPSSLNNVGFDSKDLQKILLLVKSLGINNDMNSNDLSDLTNNYLSSGVSSRKLRDFTTKIGGLDGSLVDGFLNYAKTPRIKIFITKDGQNDISDEFADLYDPFTDSINSEEAENRKRQMELDIFRKNISPNF